MAQAWAQFKAGIMDARWALYFTLMFVPTGLLAAFLAAAIEGGTAGEPGVWTWVLVSLTGLGSLLWAAWKEAPYGALGRPFWRVARLAVAFILIQRMERAPEVIGTEVSVRVYLGRHDYQITARLVGLDEAENLLHRPVSRVSRHILYEELSLTP